MVKDKVDSYDANAAEVDQNAEFTGKEGISFFKMISRHASFKDYCLLIFGCIAAAGFGAAMPAFCLIFGNLIDGLG